MAIDRAKSGGTIDTLLDGKAPAGYGLGTKSKWLTSNDDLNNIYQGGFYYWYGSNVPANIPTGINYAGMFVIARSSTEFVQIIYAMAGSLNYSNAELRRTAYNEVWYEWEWVNPPMALGVEYRTTERYMGKPVYYQRISYGTTLPASGFAQRVVSTLPIATTNILDIDVTVKNGTTYEVQKLPCISDSGVVLSVANAIQYNNYDNYCIRVRVFSDMSAWSIQKIVVKYTKTTD